MHTEETLRRIVQLKKEGKASILGSMLLHLIDECMPAAMAEITKEIHKMAGLNCVYIEPEILETQATQMIFNENLPVRFSLSQNQSPYKDEIDYEVFLNGMPYRVTIEAKYNELEEILKGEIGNLNELGLNLEYAGQYVPPDA